MNRIEQLKKLKDDLEALVSFLKNDNAEQWVSHFEGCLSEVNILINGEFTQEQLNVLSVTIRSVYGGSGSFNDYVPSHKYEECEKHSSNVYDAALELKVIGHY